MTTQHIQGFHVGVINHPGPGALDAATRPTVAEQLAALNAALTAEVLRHAETKRKLMVALTWAWVKERLEPVEVVRQVPVVVQRTVQVVVPRPPRRRKPIPSPEPEPTENRHWEPGPIRQRVGTKFPLRLAQRTGLPAVIQRSLLLRSGAVLDPVTVAARHQGATAVFPDSSWLVLSVLAQCPGEYVSRAELETAMADYNTRATIRSAIHRARQTLESVGACGDLESRGSNVGGWRLLLTEVEP